MASYPPQFDDAFRLDPKTRFALLRFDQRRRRLLIIRAAMIGIATFFACMFIIMLLDYLFFMNDPLRWLLSLLGYTTTILVVWYTGMNRFASRDLPQLARQLEAFDPRVREDLLSAVELADPHQSNGSKQFVDVLQASVAKRVAAVDMRRLLPIGLIQRWISTGATITVVCLVVSLIPSLHVPRRLARAALPGFAIQRASDTVIHIVLPEPATGYVAEGDVVAIVAEISGKPADVVTLRWRESDGETGESRMLARGQRAFVADSLQAGTSEESSLIRYAANLSFSDRAIQYQLTAGDAVTLWHTLTPLPRPRTELFDVRYQFPEYAKLDDRVESNSHGDLQALAGSKAEVTVTFDQPVSEATIRFVGRELQLPMSEVDATKRVYRISLPIRTSEQYQVDAISSESGLGNPFSPTYSIAPVLDVPPTVRWSSRNLQSLLVAPTDVADLSVLIQDDMPIATLVQEYSVNGQAWVQRKLVFDATQREFEHAWDWDLTSLETSQGESLRLNPGDLVRTRVSVADRRGQQAESTILDVLIADEGFASDRHQRLMQQIEISRELRQWIAQGEILANQLNDAAERPAENADPDRGQRIASWSAESSVLIERLAKFMQNSRWATESSNIELLGQSVLHLTRSLAGIARDLDVLLESNSGDKSKSDKDADQELKNHSRSFEQDAERTNQMVENLYAISLTFAVASDAMLLEKSLRPIADPNSLISAGRLPRYLQIANDRLKFINELVDRDSELLPDSTRRHLQGDGWRGWSTQWSQRIDGIAIESVSEPILRGTANDLYQELRSRTAHSLVDGRLASTYAKAIDSVRQQIEPLSDLIDQSANLGDAWVSAQSSVGLQKSPAEARLVANMVASSQQQFDASKSVLEKRITDEADLHRQRPVVDLRYAADLGLLVQALKTVGADGYRPYQDIPADEVYEVLSDSIEIIDSVHDVNRLYHQLTALRDAERDFADSAESKILRAFWLDQYRVEIAEAAKRIKKLNLSSSVYQSLSEAGNNDDFELAKSRLEGRRWNNDPPLSAFRQLESLVAQVGDVLDELRPTVDRAREDILRFVKTLSEQAREAAQLAAEAASRSEAAKDADQDSVKALAQQQKEAEAAAEETVQRLHDRANTADLTNEMQRELAHDADLAAAAIESATQRAQKSIEEAKTEPAAKARREDVQDNQQALSDLAETLQLVADHFEKSDQEQDPSASREALRNAIEQSQLREEAEQRQRRAEALAKAAESDPEEMLKRLESALKDNEVMQDELSDIASRAMDEALNKLRQASNQEQAVQRSLQRSDPAIAEMKKRINAAIKQMSARVAALDDANLQAAQHASDLEENGQTRSQLDDIRKQLRQAVTDSQPVGGDQALLSEISGVAQQFANDLDRASELIKKAAEEVADQPSNNPLAGSAQTIQRLQQIDNERRNILIRAITNEERAWANEVRATGPRLQQAQRQQREAKQAIEKIESAKAKSKPDDSGKMEEQQADLRAAEQRFESATKAVQEARKTNEFASRMESQASQRARKLRTESRPELDPDRPVNQSVQQTLNATRSEIEAIQEELANWQEFVKRSPPLQANSDEAKRQLNRQDDVKADVADAGEDIRRAARHEQRLEKDEVADAVMQIADAVHQEALPAAEEAHRSLQRASQDSTQSSSANEDLQAAAEEIDRTAALLQELLAGSSDQQATSKPEASPSSQESSGQSTLSEEQSKQLAKTLDELDRAMLSSQSKPPASENSQDGESQSASSESTASSPGTPPSEAQPSGSPPQSAAEASPTLASMLEGEQQDAARQRRGQKPPDARANKSSTKPQGDEPSEGERSLAGLDDPALDTSSIERANEDWGDLRQQAPDDVLESEWSTALPQYRREVSAYFRAIAERSVKESQP